MTIAKQEIIEMAIDAGFKVSKFDGQIGGFDVDLFDLARAIYKRGVRDERNACLAEIETGIWVDKTTEEVLAEIADAIRARGEAFRLCKGTGERDSGGSQPWGAAIMVECECQQSDRVTVPVEPTRAMLDAARTDLVRDGEIDPMLKCIWRAMVGASQR